MSGIAGLLHFDGQSVGRHHLERVAKALGPHGPDRSDVMVPGSVGLVHVLMRMTPEDQFCHQPWRGASGAAIVADLRLDNRDDVLASIGISKLEATAWEDARVLLAAWEKIGDAIWPALRGPFAAAIWDPRSRALTLARDHLGLNVVMWHKNERLFAFATMPKGLFALPDVPRELSEEKFADFLVLNHADHATTIYRNIFRVPAGTCADRQSCRWVDRATPLLVASRYQANPPFVRPGLCGWSARMSRPAVRRQMRSAHPIGCHLTGGLDSSSVSALAARALGEKGQRLAAFTQVPRKGFDGATADGSYADETPYVEAISRSVGNIDLNYVHNDACDDFAELERFFLALDGPVRNPTSLGWMLAIDRLARGRVGGCCWAAFTGTTPSAGTAGRKRSITCCAAGCSRPFASGACSIVIRLIRAGWRFANSSSNRWCRSEWAIGPIAAAARTASRRGRITPRSGPISPPRCASMPAQGVGHDFLTGMRPGELGGRPRTGRLCRRLDRGGEGRHRRRSARPDRRHRRDFLLLRRSARAVSRRRHRSLADPPRHVGSAAGKRADQQAERFAGGGLVREAGRPARPDRGGNRRAFVLTARAGPSTSTGSTGRSRTGLPAAGRRPKSSRNITLRSRAAWRARGSCAGWNPPIDRVAGSRDNTRIPAARRRRLEPSALLFFGAGGERKCRFERKAELRHGCGWRRRMIGRRGKLAVRFRFGAKRQLAEKRGLPRPPHRRHACLLARRSGDQHHGLRVELVLHPRLYGTGFSLARMPRALRHLVLRRRGRTALRSEETILSRSVARSGRCGPIHNPVCINRRGMKTGLIGA